MGVKPGLIRRLMVAAIALSYSSWSLGFSLEVPSGIYLLEKTHGYITFSYSHLGFSTPQVGFGSFDVVANVDAELPANSTLEVTIDPSSVDSRVPELDDKFRGENFFNVEKYPTITFLATKIEMLDVGKARITGDLTLKGVTNPVVLQVHINKAALHPMRNLPTIGLDATTELKRSDWNLGAHVPAVSDKVDLQISLELMRKQEPQEPKIEQ